MYFYANRSPFRCCTLGGFPDSRVAKRVGLSVRGDEPSEDTVQGLRDRRILAVGVRAGLRRADIAALKLSDLHQNRGSDSLRVIHNGGRREAQTSHPLRM